MCALKIAPLDKVGWLACESKELRDWVIDVGRWRAYAAGQLIYNAGDPSDGIYGLGAGILESDVSPYRGGAGISPSCRSRVLDRRYGGACGPPPDCRPLGGGEMPAVASAQPRDPNLAVCPSGALAGLLSIERDQHRSSQSSIAGSKHCFLRCRVFGISGRVRKIVGIGHAATGAE